MWVAEFTRRQRDGMGEEWTKSKATELFWLPPRKRFKVMEQQRRRAEEKLPLVRSHCSDVTNALPLRRETSENVTSHGFLVLEKAKLKLQQQELQENVIPAMPPLPPRPVALKRKETPALPLSAPTTMNLNFEGKNVHSFSPSAFKCWGSSPKLGIVPEASSEFPGSKKSETRDFSGYRLKRYQRDNSSLVSVVGDANAWIPANGTTLSINKAQDVEMISCKVPFLSSSVCGSETHILVPASTTSSASIEPIDLISEGESGSQVVIDDHMVGATQIIEVDTMTTEFPSAPVGGVMHEVHDVEQDGMESKLATGIISSDLGRFAALDDSDVTDDPHSSPGNMTTVVTTANVNIPQVNFNEELAGNSQRTRSKRCFSPVVGPTQGNLVHRMKLSVAMEFEEGDKGKPLGKVQDPEEANHRAHATNATLGMPGTSFSHFTNLLTTGSPIVALGNQTSNVEISNVSKTVENSTVIACCTNKDKTLLNPCDKSIAQICSGGLLEEQAVRVVIDPFVCLGKVEVVENKAPMEAALLSSSLAVAGIHDVQEARSKQDGSLAEVDERVDNLFKRMFEREGYEGCEVKQDSIDDFLSPFFFVSGGVNGINGPVFSMELKCGPTLESPDLEVSTPFYGSRAVFLTGSEDYQIGFGRSFISVVVEGQYVPPEKMTSEMADSSSRASAVHEDSVGSEDEVIDSPIPYGLKYGSSKMKKSQESDCKSSKEDSNWDLEMDIPSFSFGKRGGMTQRVKAPGLWLERSGVGSSNLDDDEAGPDEDVGGCDICRNPDAEPSDPIVYCDGCNVPVHADCYGNPLGHGVPEGDWFCAQCLNGSTNSRICCLCPKSGGAMKMTTDGNWAHLSCAVFVPEVYFRKADDLEGIDTSHVPSRRWLSTCSVCKSTGGACVDCTEIGCKSSFHVSCALMKDLALEFRNGRRGAIVISFCQEHTAAWDEQQEAWKAGRSKYRIVSREPQKTRASLKSKLR